MVNGQNGEIQTGQNGEGQIGEWTIWGTKADIMVKNYFIGVVKVMMQG